MIDLIQQKIVKLSLLRYDLIKALSATYRKCPFLPARRDQNIRPSISCRRVSLCPSVRPSVTSQCSTETAKRRITQTTPYDSPAR